MLFFNRPVKIYIPSCIDNTPLLDEIVRKNQNEKYKRIKEYTPFPYKFRIFHGGEVGI